MPKSSPNPSASASSVVPRAVETAAWLAREGIKSVLLRPRSKAAVDKGYERPDYDPPDPSAWNSGENNIGAVTGLEGAVDPARGGLGDVDLDCVEAVVRRRGSV